MSISYSTYNELEDLLLETIISSNKNKMFLKNEKNLETFYECGLIYCNLKLEKFNLYLWIENKNNILLCGLHNTPSKSWYKIKRESDIKILIDFFKNKDKIYWNNMIENPSIFVYDYESMQKHFFNTYGKELIETLYNPKNFHKFGKDHWNIDEDL